MMKNPKKLGMACVTLAMVISIVFLSVAADGGTKPTIIAIEGAAYNVNWSMEDNLKQFIGKDVYVTLNSGKSFAGFVKDVGKHLVHIEKIVGKDFFDALIRIEDISAIDTKFRDYQR